MRPLSTTTSTFGNLFDCSFALPCLLPLRQLSVSSTFTTQACQLEEALTEDVPAAGLEEARTTTLTVATTKSHPTTGLFRVCYTIHRIVKHVVR